MMFVKSSGDFDFCYSAFTTYMYLIYLRHCGKNNIPHNIKHKFTVGDCDVCHLLLLDQSSAWSSCLDCSDCFFSIFPVLQMLFSHDTLTKTALEYPLLY